MPITTDALLVGLKAGAQAYNVKTLGWMPNATPSGDISNSIKSSLFIVGIATTDLNWTDFSCVTTPSSLPDGTTKDPVGESSESAGSFFLDPVVKSGKAKTWLNTSAVLNITRTTTIRKIAFALADTETKFTSYYQSGGEQSDFSQGWGFSRNNRHIIHDIPSKKTTSESPVDRLGDVFMVIDVNISVTEGGFLTIKGADENFTYITLESTS